MKSMTRPLAFAGQAFSLLLALFFLSPIASGHPQIGPLDLSGELHGAPYRIIVPANWNGTLLVYAHGYRDKADHPGEVDDRSANFEGLEPALLSFGYAVAASAYRDNGWVVEDGVQDIKDLTVLFRSQVAVPDRTILLGASMGSVITFKSMEQFGGIYDGAICLCAIGAGASRSFDRTAAGTLAYDILFGIPASWGTVGDVRNDIDDETEVFPKLFTEVSNTFNFPKFEFIRLVAGVPGQGIFLPPPPTFYPYYVFATGGLEARADLERRAGGPIVQNLNHNYTLTAAEKAYLASMGVDADALLAQMNARRNIVAPPAPRNYVERNADYSGKIKQPVLTLHTIIDEIVPVSNESAYAATNAAAGRQDFLFQAYTNGVANANGQYHCNFTGPQIFSALFAMDSWVSTGVRPTAASFPAFLGFVPGYVPPPFPQP